MSSQSYPKRGVLNANPLGNWLHALHQARGLPLRVVATETEMDPAFASRSELGPRLPAEKQIAAFAAFLQVSLEKLEARRVQEKFWIEHKGNPAAARVARLIAREMPARPNAQR